MVIWETVGVMNLDATDGRVLVDRGTILYTRAGLVVVARAPRVARGARVDALRIITVGFTLFT